MVKLLIVDDEKEICEEFKETLEQEGFEVDVATKGKDGLQKIRENLYNLVLLDETMPGMEGDKVLSTSASSAKFRSWFISGF